jgi:ABC-2 type transport system permease protein
VINTDPKHLPAGLLSVEHSKYERTLAAALRNTGYYDNSMLASEAEAERGLAQGELLFVINMPANFDRSVDRGETPSILVDADATAAACRFPRSIRRCAARDVRWGCPCWSVRADVRG